MSLFYNATIDESYPHPLDVTLGVLFILVFVISLTLNPISFLYHSKKSALCSALYAYLSVCDFCVTLWNSLHVGELLLRRDRPKDHVADLREIVLYTVYYTFAAYSGLLINFILMCRAFNISRPLTVIPRDAVIRLIAAVLGLYTMLQILTVVIPGKFKPCWHSSSLSVQYRNSLEVVVWITYVIVFIPGSLSVIVAIQHLFRSDTRKNNTVSKIDCFRIVMLSIPNIAYPVFLSYQHVIRDSRASMESCERSQELADTIDLITRSILPMFSSAWNPVFVVFCTKEIRIMIARMLSSRKMKKKIARSNQYNFKLESNT